MQPIVTVTLVTHDYCSFAFFIYQTISFCYACAESHCLCDDGWTHDAATQLCTVERCADGRTFCMNGGRCDDAGNACVCPDNTAGEQCEDGRSD